MSLVFEKNKIPGYSLVAPGLSVINTSGLMNSTPEQVVVLHFPGGTIYNTGLTAEALGMVENKPAFMEQTVRLGEAIITSPVHTISEDCLLSIVAMFNDKDEVPR